MPKAKKKTEKAKSVFRVSAVEKVYYYVDIEADSADKALDKANELEGSGDYQEGSKYNFEIYDIQKMK